MGTQGLVSTLPLGVSAGQGAKTGYIMHGDFSVDHRKFQLHQLPLEDRKGGEGLFQGVEP